MRNSHAVRMIAAVASNGVIGRYVKGKPRIPWNPTHYPGEQVHFKHTTTLPGANTLVMGRSTWDSLPKKHRPLPNRTNFVLSRNPDFEPEGAKRFSNLDEAVDASETDVWIIGGGTVYEEAMGKPYLDGLVLSHLNHSYEGDVRFPKIPADFVAIERDERTGFTIIYYERKR